MTNRRQELIGKLNSKTERLTKAESDELGPVTARELAPVSGDAFVDDMLSNNEHRRLNKLAAEKMAADFAAYYKRKAAG